MNSKVEIDEIDVKILAALIRDARTSLKEIAKNCGITSAAILKRIKHLKNSRVITGTTLFHKIELFGRTQVITIGINLDYTQQPEIVELLQKQANVVEISSSIGKYDLYAFVLAKDIHEVNDIMQTLRKHPGVKRIVANTWVTDPQFLFENLDLQPTKV